jgi:hypothetical protein
MFENLVKTKKSCLSHNDNSCVREEFTARPSIFCDHASFFVNGFS